VTSLADATIAALRANHDATAALATSLNDDDLNAPSGAEEWPVAQVLSHLGSAAEISLATLRSALGEGPAPDQAFNEGVWDRWNALDPQAQRDGFVEQDARLVEAYEALTTDQRESVEVSLGFLPHPLPLAAVAGMRLNEASLHGWDVAVAVDPDAALLEETADVVLQHFSGGLGFLLGFTGKADAVDGPAVVAIDGTGLAIVVDGKVSLQGSAPEATATFSGPSESVVRLIAGRLKPVHTPAAVQVSGNVTLDDLRRVFPGY
jgi:uncharacterized protein (TIGR03083 family)